MIGSSLPLCYPQIGAPNLFFPRALCRICPLTKHIRLVGVCAFQAVCVAWSWFRQIGVPRLAHQRVTPAVGLQTNTTSDTQWIHLRKLVVRYLH